MDLPLGVGLRVPGYDRVDGLSLPFGPRIVFGDERVVIDPTVTYRSNLGKIDPALTVAGNITRDSSLAFSVTGSRGTFTNEGWIRDPLTNSLVTFWSGSDSRNYFRADRAEARLIGRLPGTLDGVTLFVGGRTERDWSTGWRPGERRGPFSIINRSDSTDGIDRPNPLITPGHITSAIAGGRAEYTGIRADAWIGGIIERATSGSVTGAFTQATLDTHGGVETVAAQRIVLNAHLVTTATSGATGVTPTQRFGYLGGAGTLATVPTLVAGGDHLWFF
ncbi:MAG TPA: hypothetical protein VGT98_08780, partial [Candidatus Elarobacter sp.]|nr:hypothetical protein [Candidatus Elarobacter sp.]